MILPFLADEETTDLSPFGYARVKAVWRPCDILDKSRWADACRQAGCSTISAEARFLLVKSQLLRIEGDFVVQEKVDGKLVERPFDVTKDVMRIPLPVIYPLFNDIEQRASLSEGVEKNSEGPSDSTELKSPSAS